MDVPVNAEVVCADGPCGQSTYVILNPVTHEVTHVVVRDAEFPHVERLVPLEFVIETKPHHIHLRCSQQEFSRMDPFVETEFLSPGGDPYAPYNLGDYRLWPYVLPDQGLLQTAEHEQIPPGELAVPRGAEVMATDGRVGRVDEFLVNPANMHITHLVLREGHLWGQKDVTIPVSEIERISPEAVYLKLSKREIERLPAIPLRRGAEESAVA